MNRMNNKKREERYQVEGHAHGPDVPSAQYRPIVPVILEFKVCRGDIRRLRIEPTLQLRVDVHVALFLVGGMMILDGPGPRHLGVPERRARGHEQRVVHVARVGEHREVERQEPRFAPRDDAEVRWAQRGVREGAVQRRAVVVLEVV